MSHVDHRSRRLRVGIAAATLLALATINPGFAQAAAPTELTIQSTTVLDRSTIHPGPAGSAGTFEGSTSGTFVSSGAINASGTEATALTFTGVFAPDSDVVHGVATFVGAAGTFTLSWQALHLPFEDPVFGGAWTLTGATGSYGGLHGSGSVLFSIVGEQSNNPVITETWSGFLQ